MLAALLLAVAVMPAHAQADPETPFPSERPASQEAADAVPAASQAAAPGAEPFPGAAPQSLPVVVIDSAQAHVDITPVVLHLPAHREAAFPGPVPLVLSDEEADFARVWMLFALQNPTGTEQRRVIAIDRAALWSSGIAPVRSGLSELGTWRTMPPVVPPPTPPEAAYGPSKSAEARFAVTLPPESTVSFALPLGATAQTPIHIWTPAALAAADRGGAIFAGLIVGALAIAFAFFAAQWAQHVVSGLKGSSAGNTVPAAGAVRLAALLTGGTLLYQLSAQGFLAAAFNWSAGWDARMAGVTLALAAAAAAHVLATERIRALSADREQLARLAEWVAPAGALLVLILPAIGLPFIRLIAFLVAVGGVAALTAGTGASGQRVTPAAGELRTGWGLMALAAVLAALATQGFMPRTPAVEMIIHALAGLGVLIAAYALAGPTAATSVRAAARRSMALGRTRGASGAISPGEGASLPDASAIRAEQRNALALAGSSEAVWDLDVTTGMLYVDPSLEAHLGLVPGSLCGRLETWMARVDRDDRRHVSQVLDENVERGNATFTLEMRLSHADPVQGARWLELCATCFAGESGNARRCIGTIRDVTQRREEQAGLVRETLHDPLTGLANRPLFTDRLHRACLRARGTHERIALVLADLDRFKSINESLGHAAADTVLAALAQRLKALIAPEDTLARINGDTFALLISGWSDETGPAEIATLVNETISQPLEVSGREIFPTASIGYAIRQPHHERGEVLLGEADLALRLAKKQGNAVTAFHPDMRPADDELATESGLRRALERGEIHLAYQPIVRLETGQLAGFEALIRWRHPERGLISPDEFVPLAERTGQIVDLGAYVLQQAVQDLARWQQDFPQETPLFSSVNVSSRQLLEDLPGQVATLLANSDIAPETLRLEVTESLVMDDPERAAAILSAVKETGVRLALDDFGTGYSSLSYLKQFPFDVVKIDKSFVQAMGTDSDQEAIVRSVLALARDLKLDVVAEGVEDDAARASLQAQGCTYGQGFFFGQPLEADNAHDFIARHFQ